MNRLIYKALLVTFIGLIAGCSEKDEEIFPLPTKVDNIRVEPRVGGALVIWEVPTDSNYLYVQTRYEKNGRIVNTNSSVYTDSVLITGLLNKFEYAFDVQVFNEAIVGGEVYRTSEVRPIRRPLDITYEPSNAEIIELTPAMIDTYTQESSEGPKQNLVDGNINTYWHTAWSSGVAPLPHWIQINFDAPEKLGGMHYTFRQNTDETGRPSKFDLQTSEDGVTWETVWESTAGLQVVPVDQQRTLTFGQNHESRYFRIRILENPGNKTYTHLSTIQVFTMGERVVDLEEIAEENYR